MAVNLPDPRQAARTEADWLIPVKAMMMDVDRVLADCPHADHKALLAGLEDFHKERMTKIPSAAKYPESAAWVKHVSELDKHLQAFAGLTDLELATYRSLNAFLTYRGFAQAAAVKKRGIERCRIAYLPDTDRGAATLKNVDDPITHYKPDPKPYPHLYGGGDLMQNGVGSGLHMDDEPDELFPLNPIKMMASYCSTTPEAVEFLTRYSPFWGGGNLLLHDSKKQSAAIEKCSANFIEVFHPGPDGRSHVSGMVCRDPNSPLGKHQAKMRKRYLDAFGLKEDGTDNTYWNFGYQFETMLAKGLRDLGPKAKYAEIEKLFITEFPAGLNKPGVLAHPDIAAAEWTLQIYASLLDEKKTYRWQRTREGKFPDKPEVFQF